MVAPSAPLALNRFPAGGHGEKKGEETHLAVPNELYERQLLVRLELDRRGHLRRRAHAYLEELLRLLPPLERPERDAPGVVVDQVIVVGQVGKRRVDVRDGYLKHGQGGGEVSCCDTGLFKNEHITSGQYTAGRETHLQEERVQRCEV